MNRPEVVELPIVISTVFSTEQIRNYLMGLPKGALFGYSSAFSHDQITDTVEGLGMKVGFLSKRHPLRKQYGEYVRRVITPFRISDPVIRAHFEEVYFCDRKTSKGNIKCKAPRCKKIINKDTVFLEIVNLGRLPNGQLGYKKTSYCAACATKYLQSKIKQLLKVMPKKLSKTTLMKLTEAN